MNLFVKKPINQLIETAEGGEYQLKRSLGALNLVSLGIGAIIGAGLIYIDRYCRSRKCGACRGAFLCGGGHRLCFCGLVLQRAGVHDPCGRICIHLCICHHGRIYCLDHWLGFGFGICGGLGGGGGQLVTVCRFFFAGFWHQYPSPLCCLSF